MTYRRNSSGKMVMNCMTYSKFGPSECSSHNIGEQEFDEYVINDLKRISKICLDEEFYNSIDELKIQEQDNSKLEIKNIEKRFIEIRDITKSLYEDEIRGIISEDDFLNMTREYGEEKTQLSKRLEKIKSEKTDNTQNFNYYELLKDIANFNIINKAILSKLIDKIEISKDREIFIYYQFQKP